MHGNLPHPAGTRVAHALFQTVEALCLQGAYGRAPLWQAGKGQDPSVPVSCPAGLCWGLQGAPSTVRVPCIVAACRPPSDRPAMRPPLQVVRWPHTCLLIAQPSDESEHASQPTKSAGLDDDLDDGSGASPVSDLPVFRPAPGNSPGCTPMPRFAPACVANVLRLRCPLCLVRT